MPCYTEWDAYLDKASDEYASKKAEMEAKLKAVRHIVDYYYGVAGLRVPPARHSGRQTWQEMAHREFLIDPHHLPGAAEDGIVKSIAHHCACDGIDFLLLYDLVSLLDVGNVHDAGYARVLLTCADELRANREAYRPVMGTEGEGASEPHRRSPELDPKRLP